MRIPTAATLLIIAAAGTARAEPPDAYCEKVEGVADAQSATLFAPDLFASFGYVDQPETVMVPDSTANDLRITAGIRYKLSGIYEGVLTKKRAKADCQRHEAIGQVQGDTTYHALEAEATVLDDAMAKADKMLDGADADLDKRRATAQEVQATRLRVDALREMTAETHRQLDALPAPAQKSMRRALDAYYSADAEVERQDAALRRAKAIDLSVRFGYDKFAGGDDQSPYFAVVTLGVNLGVIFQGKGNQRAARGEARLIREDAGAQLAATETQLKSLLEIEAKREQETGVLEADLKQQLDALDDLGGAEAKRYRQTVWFDWVKASAEHAYFAAHAASLREILGEEAP
jgi:hypothetical protein